jgi:oligopeptide/dipeptide ABC transporter ATP-binding protein
MARSVSPHIKISESVVPGNAPKPLLRVEDLVTTVFINGRDYYAVDHVSFDVGPGEVLGLVGESAAGKSMTALSIIRLVRPPARIAAGRIIFDGTDLLELSEPEMSKVRGRDIAMVSQDPMTALNPVKTIGDQLTRVIRLHEPVSKDEATRRAIDMMKRVGIPAPAERLRSYPHQFSGGMLQRISIAMALSCNPKLLIADEPTTALDVTIQAQILELLQSLRNDFGMAVLLITHNLGVVAEFCDRVAVMYAGKIVEDRETRSLVRAPRHPYAEGLLSVSPTIDQHLDRLPTIKGRMPSLQRFPAGCRFHPRCPHAFERCPVEVPALLPLPDGSRVACHLYDGKLERIEHPDSAKLGERT